MFFQSNRSALIFKLIRYLRGCFSDLHIKNIENLPIEVANKFLLHFIISGKENTNEN